MFLSFIADIGIKFLLQLTFFFFILLVPYVRPSSRVLQSPYYPSIWTQLYGDPFARPPDGRNKPSESDFGTLSQVNHRIGFTKRLVSDALTLSVPSVANLLTAESAGQVPISIGLIELKKSLFVWDPQQGPVEYTDYSSVLSSSMLDWCRIPTRGADSRALIVLS